MNDVPGQASGYTLSALWVYISQVCLSDSERVGSLVGGRHGTRSQNIWSFSSLLAYVALGLASHAEPWFPWEQVRLHQEVVAEVLMDPGRWNRYVVGMRECGQLGPVTSVKGTSEKPLVRL